MHLLTKAISASALAVLLAALAGCSGTFQANVANQSPHPVTVKMTYTKWYGGKKVLLTERVAPGDAARLGPIDAPASGARLEAYPEGIAAPRSSVNISSGETTAHVIGVFLDRGIPGVEWRIIETDRE